MFKNDIYSECKNTLKISILSVLDKTHECNDEIHFQLGQWPTVVANDKSNYCTNLALWFESLRANHIFQQYLFINQINETLHVVYLFIKGIFLKFY